MTAIASCVLKSGKELHAGKISFQISCSQLDLLLQSTSDLRLQVECRSAQFGRRERCAYQTDGANDFDCGISCSSE